MTLVGCRSTANVTGLIGADTVINTLGVNIFTTDPTNSNDSYLLDTGTVTLSYIGNTYPPGSGTSSAGAITNNYARNFTSTSISFENNLVTSATNITALAVSKVEQYDSAAVSSTTIAAGHTVAGGQTDTASGVEIVIDSGFNDYIAAAHTGIKITGGAGANKVTGGVGTNTIIILVVDSGFSVISSPTDVMSALADIVNLAA